ncbi:MAG: hypothetical protein IJ113_06870 [Eggerthellaceae bacterium]|nr:hypothetical protein [Eggerthellaceae bacterium]
MNDQIQGVYVYGGGPQSHYVFTAQAQRQRRQQLIKVLVLAALIVVCAWCIRSAFLAFAEPPQAAADTAPISQVQPAEQNNQQPARA